MKRGASLNGCRFKLGVAAGVSCALMLLSVHSARAHNLGAECKLRGERVDVEAFFDDDTVPRNARVNVLDAQRQLVASGRTDEKGRWSFPAPRPGVYQVEIDAGAGHRTSIKIIIPGVRSEQTPAAVARPRPEEPATTISEGSTRAEFTRFPWLRVAVGLTVIAVLSLGLWLALQRMRTAPRPPVSPPSA
jgi:hypothetical protein